MHSRLPCVRVEMLYNPLVRTLHRGGKKRIANPRCKPCTGGRDVRLIETARIYCARKKNKTSAARRFCSFLFFFAVFFPTENAHLCFVKGFRRAVRRIVHFYREHTGHKA